MDKLSDNFRDKLKLLFTVNANKNPHTQPGRIYTLVWSPNGDSIAFNSSDKSIVIAKVEQNKITTSKVLTGHTDEVIQLQFCPVNDQVILSASYDKTIRLWDLKTTFVLAKVKVDCSHLDWGTKEIAVVGRDSVIYFLDEKNLKILKKMPLKMDIKGIRWGTDQSLIYIITGESSILVISHSQQKVIMTLNAHTASCQCLEFDKTGRFFAVGSSDATVSVWTTKEHICLYSQLRLDWPVRSLGFSFDGNVLAASSEEDSNIDVSMTCNGLHSGYWRDLSIFNSFQTLSVVGVESILIYAVLCM